MTDKKDGPSKGPERAAPTGAGSKRPFATIDLAATEVKPEPSKPGNESRAPAAAPTITTPSASGTGNVGPAGQSEAAARIAAAAAGSADKSAEQPRSSAGSATAGTAGATAKDRPSGATASTSVPRVGTPAGSPPDSGRIGRVLSHLAAGILGGSVVLATAQWLGLGTGRSASVSPSPDFVGRLTALETSVRDRLSAPATGGAPIRNAAETKQIEALSAQLASLGETQSRLIADTGALKEVLAKAGTGSDPGDRLSRLEEQIGTMANAATTDPQNAGRLPQLAQLTGKVADLEQQLATRLEVLRKDVAQDVGSRIGTVAEVTETARAGTQRLDREVAGLKAETARLGQRIDQFKSGTDRTDTNVAALQEQATRLQAGIEAVKSEMQAELKSVARPADIARAVTPVTDKVAALESSMQGVVSAEEARRTNAQRIVLSLELGNLKRALERGDKYQGELAEVKRIAGTRLDLAALERYQSTGVPTIPELARAFRTVANSVLDADAMPEGASVVDRLLTGAKTIVRVRRTTHADNDDSAEAIVARMETALTDGRLGDVLAEAKKLPPRATAPAQEWLGKVEARQSVDTALASIDAALKSSLGGVDPAAQRGTKP